VSLPRTDRRPLGRPSPAAQARLADSVRRELGDLEVRIEEARLRAEVFRVSGRPDAAAEALAEQQNLLTSFATRLQSAVSSSVVERDAEDVVASALAGRVVTSPPEDVEPSRRRPVLSGVASALAVVAALAITLLPGSGPAAIDAIGAADVAEDPPAAPSDEPSAGRAPGEARPAIPAPTAAPVLPAPAPAASADRVRAVDGGAADTGPGTDQPDAGLTTLVEGLLNAVNGVVAPPEAFGGPDLPLPDVPQPPSSTDGSAEAEPEPTESDTESVESDAGDAESSQGWLDGSQ
jgi:hypothetical protein